MPPDSEKTPETNGDGAPSDETTAPEIKAEPKPSAPPEVDPLDAAKAETSKLRDQLLRTAADYENYRKRSRRDVDDAQKKGTEEILRALLPVFDNLERAVLHAEQSTDAKAIADGVRMVLKQFQDSISRVGIKRVAGLGQPFDPLVHEAIQQIETAEQPPGTVMAEVQPGYMLGDRLLRAALVVVAKPPAGSARAPGEPSEPPKDELS